MSDYRPTIGLEVHAQLSTETKLFCGCRTSFGESPNTNVCEICLGLPGVLPVLNRNAVELAMRVAIALNCRINRESIFARKNYFYPDLPKGYQITQYRYPLAVNGALNVNGKNVRIKRVHLEEESAKLTHEGSMTLIDYNRAGVPLIEVVTEPDIDSSSMAVEYLKKLQKILQFTSASEAVMARGEFRCEPNISVSRSEDRLGTRTEIKNLNSFRAVKNALDYEIDRHRILLEKGMKVRQETMHYNEETGETKTGRVKEQASDYRYFPEPDLPVLFIDKAWIDEVREKIPEMPEERVDKYIEWGINRDDALIITGSIKASELFEKTVSKVNDAVEVSKWIVREFRSLNEPDITASQLAALIEMVIEEKISRNAAQEVFEEMASTGKHPEKIVDERDLVQISDEKELESILKEVFEENPAEFERYKNGDVKLKGFFIGEVMKKSGGKADPREVKRLLSEYE